MSQRCIDKLQKGDRVLFIWNRTTEQFSETFISIGSNKLFFLSKDACGIVRATYFEDIQLLKIFKCLGPV